MVEVISGLAHCQHHDKHWEYCYDLNERIKYIKEKKPKEEQALRLKLFQIVPLDKVPGKDSLEWQAYEQAKQAKFGKDNLLEFVEVIQEPIATISTDLSKYIKEEVK